MVFCLLRCGGEAGIAPYLCEWIFYLCNVFLTALKLWLYPHINLGLDCSLFPELMFIAMQDPTLFILDTVHSNCTFIHLWMKFTFMFM